MVVGRAGELAALDQLLDAVIGGRTAAVLLVGEPGVGKTALIEETNRRAEARGITTVRITCLEVEGSISGAGLELALARLGHGTDNPGPESLLQGLVAAAATAPVLLVVDDIQWLDEVSRAGLAFAVRRLQADPVGVVLAGRPEVRRWRELREVAIVEVGALPEPDAVDLLRESMPGMRLEIAREVSRSLGCLPLALVEAAQLLTPDELAGRAPPPRPARVGPAVQQLFAAGFETLSEESRLAVAILAADDSGDAGILAAALAHVGTTQAQDVLVPAEQVGLVRLGVPPTFIHPLARSAVFAAAGDATRRRAHAALAAAARQRGDARFGLRHEAPGATGPDEGLAARLEEEAGRLAGRGAPEHASAMARLAATLSPDPGDRLRRLVAAAETSPHPDVIDDLLTEVRESTDDPVLLARSLLVWLGQNGPESDGADIERLMARIDSTALPEAMRVRLEVEHVWHAMAELDLAGLRTLLETLDDGDPHPWQLLSTMGEAYIFLGEHRRGEALLVRALSETTALDPDQIPVDALASWMFIPGWLGSQPEEHERRMAVMVERFRATKLPRPTASAAFFGAERARRAGRWARCEALYAESLGLSQALGDAAPVTRVRYASLLATQGRTEPAEALLDEASHEYALRRSPDWNSFWIPTVRGSSALAQGDPAAAVALLEPISALPFLGRGARDMVAMAGVDLVEALVALGHLDEARATALGLAQRLDGCSDPLALGFVQRCLGLVDAEAADQSLPAAVDHHRNADDPYELARSRLLLGEHLRRTRRLGAARDPLRAAFLVFQEMGARPWAARAGDELRAAGDSPTATSIPEPTLAVGESPLTPQELRVAMAVVEGMTNNDAAAALFLSPKTIEHHLGRIYRKLGVRSRGGLARALDATNH
jgi:DNA-binding CsgD family transcriptional regulator